MGGTETGIETSVSWRDLMERNVDGAIAVAAGDGAGLEVQGVSDGRFSGKKLDGCGEDGAVVHEDGLLADGAADEAGRLKHAGSKAGGTVDVHGAGEGEVAMDIWGGGLSGLLG